MAEKNWIIIRVRERERGAFDDDENGVKASHHSCRILKNIHSEIITKCCCKKKEKIILRAKGDHGEHGN